MYKGTQATPPRREHLRHWHTVCRFIDAEPYRSIQHPFQSKADPPREVPPISSRLLERMAQFGLIHHRKTDCTWRLSLHRLVILDRLAQGLPDDEEQAQSDAETQPFVADYGIDTLYINIFAEEMPTRLIDELTTYKTLAQAEDTEIATPWLFHGVPLQMFKAGKGTSQRQGVSWGFILRTETIEIRLRKVPISGIVATVRLGADTLWKQGAKASLLAMKGVLRSMWRDHNAFRQVQYQLRQIDLCADIANFPLDAKLLDGLVTHSLSQEVTIPSEDEDDDTQIIYEGEEDAFFDPWEEDFADPFDEVGDEDEEYDEEGEPEEEEENGDEDGSPGWAKEGTVVHLFGKRISGFRFSPKAALSAIWYNKLREERSHQKGWMREVHERGGWKPGMLLTRIEVRFKRGVLRELKAAFGEGKEHWFDDPWVVLNHLGDLWAYYAGLPVAADTAPDVPHRGWMRLTTPDPTDRNRTRWTTSPIWQMVQAIPFNAHPPKPLKRMKHRDPAMDHLLAEVYGMVKTIAVQRGSYQEGNVDFWDELVFVGDWATEQQAERGQTFAEEVRERARMMGKPLPLVPDQALPPRVRQPKGKGH